MFDDVDAGPRPDVIYDWNRVDSTHQIHKRKVLLLDETLRDGLQSAYLVKPSVEEKADLIRLMDALGIEFVDLGLPGASPLARDEVVALAKFIADEKLRIKPTAAARTVTGDIVPIVEASQAAGMPIEVLSFIGSSPIRMLAEEWDLSFLLEKSRTAIKFARDEGLPVTFVTEDTTRSRPDILYRLFKNAIESGVQRLCLCDTVGHVTPDGIRALLRFVWDLIKGIGEPVKVDWHGHNDRGLSLSNAIWAIQYGADRIHGCAMGIGERTGNCSMDRLILNLRLLGTYGEERDLSELLDYCKVASRILRYPIPNNYPLAGRDAFRTQTGVHAAAIQKARRKGDAWLADRVYSGVPAGMFGRHQDICIGPMSGASNATAYLEERGIPATPAAVDAVLTRAKEGNHILTEVEVLEVIRGL